MGGSGPRSVQATGRGGPVVLLVRRAQFSLWVSGLSLADRPREKGGCRSRGAICARTRGGRVRE